MIHRYHLAYYQQVAVYFWPILFFELWRVDRWTAETGRQAFVQVDRYGRAWVPWFEGMSQKPHVNGVYVEAYRPGDVDAVCPGKFETALAALTVDASATLPPTRSGGWSLGTTICHRALGPFTPWTPACAGVYGNHAYLDPG